MSKLIIKNLNLARKERVLASNLNFSFEPGKIYALMGNNGAGKTTFFKTVSGLLPVSEKKIFIDDFDINSLSIKIRAKWISLLLQNTPYEPYTLGIDRIAHGIIPNENNKNLEQVFKIAKYLNIEHLLYKALMHMSGGEQRLIYLAKCLININTKILLLDEPTVFLDMTQKNILTNFLKKAAKNKIIIFSSHDQLFIDNLASHIIKLTKNSEENSHDIFARSVCAQ